MTQKKATKKGETKAQAQVKVSPTVKQANMDESTQNVELVNEAGIDIEVKETKPMPKKVAPKGFVSSEVVVINTSQNPILLSGDEKGMNILIAPKEIKKINRTMLKTLMQNKIVRYWFDKGILTSNMDANETSAHEAETPEYLCQPVERHEGANVSASVTKFQKAENVSITL